MAIMTVSGKKSDAPARANFSMAKQPEYFVQGYEDSYPPQLCYTNEDLIMQVSQDAVDYLQGKKTGEELGISWNPKASRSFPA